MRYLWVLLLLVVPVQLRAHPHVFIDTGFEFIFDDDSRLTHMRITWAYDEFYSLLILEDRGLDGDGDGVLSEVEIDDLTGFDMNWDPGYDGDLVLMQGDGQIALAAPTEATATVRNGRIITTHLRGVKSGPLVASNLSARAFDESYYTAYDLSLPVLVNGADYCTIDRFDPDIDARLADMQAMLLRIDADADLEEMDMPLAGAEFATEIRLSCPGL